MNKYYEITAIIEGVKEVLYGCFDKSNCIYEKEAEKDGWKDQGYKKIKIESREVEEMPDSEVYSDIIVTSKELFKKLAPCLNFELSEEQILKKALEEGLIVPIAGASGKYLLSEDI